MEFCGKPDKAQMRKVEITRDLVSCRSIARSRKKDYAGITEHGYDANNFAMANKL